MIATGGRPVTRSLRRRAIVVTLLGALLVGAIAAAIFGEMGRRTVAMRAESRMRMLGRVIASAAVHASGPSGFDGTLRAMADEPSVRRLLVVGGRPPRVLGAAGPEWHGVSPDAPLDPDARAAVAQALVARTDAPLRAGAHDRFRSTHAFTLGDGSRAVALVDLDARAIHADVNELFWRVALVLVAVFALVLLALERLLHHAVLSPVAAIADAAHRYSAGDRSVRVPVPVDDEIGELARAVEAAFTSADAALHELRFHQRALDQAAAVLTTDADCRVLAANDACARLTGHAPEHLLGPLPGRVEAGVLPAALLRETYASLRDGRPWQGEICDRRKDGTTYWVAATVIPSMAPDGRPERCTAVLLDVTARKQAEAAARESELRVRQILATSLDAVITIDAAGRVLEWNTQAENLFGWTAAEMAGRSLTDTIVPPQFRRAHDRGMARYFETGEGPVLGQRIELTGMRRGGEEFPIEISINTVPGPDGAGVAFSAFVRDIGDRKRAEADLVRARDAAQAANRAKSEFLATMSHEIRTPMNGVIGFTSLLLDTPLDGSQRDFAETIRNSGQALLEIIDDILDLSKIEAGRLDVERQPFDARTAAADVVGLLSARAEEHGLDFALDWGPGVATTLMGDAKRFRQVLLNLVGNAIKFTESGAVVVRVQAAADDALRVSVEDTGNGIAHDKLPLLFRKFSQADSSTTRRFGGTGLGLAISKQLVELMGGAIGVDSQPGQGSTFWFTLPRAAGADVPEAPAPALGGQRVLVVDDGAASAGVLRDWISAWGAHVEIATSGAAAVAAARGAAAAGTPFQAVVLDHALPDASGESLGYALRTDPAAGAPALMLCVTGAQRAELSRFRAAGFAETFVKPIVRPEGVLDALARLAGGAPAAPADLVVLPVTPASAVPIAGRRVLLAEDNVVNQKLALRVLRRAGCLVDLAENGAEACAFAESNAYDIVFMDCHMPEMDGFAAARTIRAREAMFPARRRMPIVALTASVLNSDRQRCLDSGMDDFIAKPFQPAQLEDAVRRWSDGAASEGPAREAA